jgi:hypothetical protein
MCAQVRDIVVNLESEIIIEIYHINVIQMKKLCSKVEHFKELEHLLKQEHIQIRKAQAQVLADWIRFSHYNYSARRG